MEQVEQVVVRNFNIQTVKITSIIREVLDIVEEYLGEKLDEESLHYSRLVTHLEFFVHRVFFENALNDDEEELRLVVRKLYPVEYECGRKIVKYIGEKYRECKISENEITYLAIYIRCVHMEMKENLCEENQN